VIAAWLRRLVATIRATYVIKKHFRHFAQIADSRG
jgi:hypothetical protein